MKLPVKQEGQVAKAAEVGIAAAKLKPRRRRSKVKQVESAANLVFESLPEIVGALVEKAKEGSCQHAKCVFDVARIAEIEMKKPQKAEPWVRDLLNAIRGLPEPVEPTPAV